MHLHHINILCRDVNSSLRQLKSLYGFTEYGRIKQKTSHTISEVIVLKQNDIFLTLTGSLESSVDVVNDISFCVDSVQQVYENAILSKAQVIEKPFFINCNGEPYDECNFKNSCSCGMEECSYTTEKVVIQSPVKNIKHTIFCRNKKNAILWPGIKLSNDISSKQKSCIDFVDHIAIALPQESTAQLMRWYKQVFGFSRFSASSFETMQGLILKAKNGNGLKMVTLKNHPCVNTGVADVQETEFGTNGLKIVFVESLRDEGNDQIQTFLRNNNGPGVQHIAFNTSLLLSDANRWLKNGVHFLKPPAEYYAEIKDTLQSVEEKHDVNIVRDVGILIDREKHSGGDGYLYQIFTHTLFDSNTIFLELIQRENAYGFGAGNISALWRAVDAQMYPD